MIKNKFLSLLLCLAFGLSLPVKSAEKTNAVRLQGLDKITGRVFNIETKIDEPFHFGNLTILPKACYKAPPEDPPESTAFLEISETPPSGATEQVFSNWMFASSPSISSLQHPVYDVWVHECLNQ